MAQLRSEISMPSEAWDDRNADQGGAAVRSEHHNTDITAEKLLDEHGDALYAYAVSRVRRSDIAEDLVQETLLAALQSMDAFAARSEPRTWLIGILRHKIFDHYRRTRRILDTQTPHLGEETGELGLFNKRGQWAPKPQSWGADPATAAESQDFWRVYANCRSLLPTTLCEPYLLREIEGLSAQEVCKVLQITATNLSVRLHRARLALRSCLENKWFDSAGS